MYKYISSFIAGEETRTHDSRAKTEHIIFPVFTISPWVKLELPTEVVSLITYLGYLTLAALPLQPSLLVFPAPPK